MNEKDVALLEAIEKMYGEYKELSTLQKAMFIGVYISNYINGMRNVS